MQNIYILQNPHECLLCLAKWVAIRREKTLLAKMFTLLIYIFMIAF